MKRRDVRAFLWDIEKTCRIFDELLAGKTFGHYVAEAGLRMAIERGFEMIGEALRNVLEQQPALADRFTNPARVISFRNRVAHEYWRMMPDVVWSTLHDDLPILRGEVNALLLELPPPEDGDLQSLP